jgi:hypothetical protein
MLVSASAPFLLLGFVIVGETDDGDACVCEKGKQ